ncbi:MAG: preprotein translocase subunit SecG [Nitrospirae bacterium GWD2_57_9]|nr:MAG: preprotein translocase subunit SecG [Nitrospirae bacterium GWD2_57_9]OGW48355.1 MAG: preprotein translocase subunit SecG [Nitrospirae bacterium GWC2_57_9]
MRYFLISLHVIVSAILIAMVLLQKGKGADIGAAFGGASQTVFGPRGAASFLAKLTTAAAILFMVTSLGLAVTSSRRSSVMEGVKQPQQTAPAVPLAPPTDSAPAPAPSK